MSELERCQRENDQIANQKKSPLLGIKEESVLLPWFLVVASHPLAALCFLHCHSPFTSLLLLIIQCLRSSLQFSIIIIKTLAGLHRLSGGRSGYSTREGSPLRTRLLLSGSLLRALLVDCSYPFVSVQSVAVSWMSARRCPVPTMMPRCAFRRLWQLPAKNLCLISVLTYSCRNLVLGQRCLVVVGTLGVSVLLAHRC